MTGRESRSEYASGGRSQHIVDGERPVSVVCDRPCGPVRVAVTVVPDFTWDRHGKRQRMSVFSRALAASGVAVYRFDAEGSGLAGAGGRWPPDPWDTMSDEVQRVATWVADRHDPDTRHVVLGAGIGGVPAVMAAARLAAEEEKTPAGLVLVGADLVQSVRFVVTGIASVRAGEQLLPSRVFRVRERLTPRTVLDGLNIPALCVNGGADPRFNKRDNDLSRYGAQVQVVAGVSDPFEACETARATAKVVAHWALTSGQNC